MALTFVRGIGLFLSQLISEMVGGSGVRVVYPDTAHMNFLLVLAGARDVVRRLHPHERVHLHAESLLDAQRHNAGQVGLAVKDRSQWHPVQAHGIIPVPLSGHARYQQPQMLPP